MNITSCFYNQVAPGVVEKVYLVSIYHLLHINVPDELKIYSKAANEIAFAVRGLKHPRKGPTISDMGLKPTNK